MASTDKATFALAEVLGSPLACYDGAVRVCFPVITEDAVPGEHPIRRPNKQLAVRDFPATLLRIILERRRFVPGDVELRLEGLSDARFRRRLSSLEDENAKRIFPGRDRELQERHPELEAASPGARPPLRRGWVDGVGRGGATPRALRRTIPYIGPHRPLPPRGAPDGHEAFPPPSP